MEKSVDIIASLDKEIEEEMVKEKKVLQLLNEFGKIVLKKKYKPLEIDEKDNLLLLELMNSKFGALKKIIEVRQWYAQSHIAIFAFKALFLCKDHIKIEDNFENKIKCFKSILESVKNEKNTINLNELGAVNFLELYKWPILGFQERFPACVALIILNNTDSIEEFLELFLTALEINYEYESKIDFNKLKGLSAEGIISDLKVIFDNGSTKKDNHFNLKIEDGHLIRENKSNEEVMAYINEAEENDDEEEEREVLDDEEEEQQKKKWK